MKTKICVVFLVSMLSSVWMGPAVFANGDQAGITEWGLPRRDRAPAPAGIIVDSEHVWFACADDAYVGRLSPSTNTFEEWLVGTSGKDNAEYLISYEGSIYFTNNWEDKIGKLMPSMDKISYVKPPTDNSQPFGIVLPKWTLSDHPTLYFVENWPKKIGSLALGGLVFDLLMSASSSTTTVTPTFNLVSPVVTSVSPRVTSPGPGSIPGVASVAPVVSGPFNEWLVPSSGSPLKITEGVGCVWFGLSETQIGKLTLQEGPDRFDIYYLPATSPYVHDVKLDSTGNVWYSSRTGNLIGKLDPSTLAVTEWVIPTPGSDPTDIAIDTFGKVWFAENDQDKIGMLDPFMNRFSEWQVPTEYSGPIGIFIDSNNNVWFTEGESGKIGCLNTNGQMVPEFSMNTLALVSAISLFLSIILVKRTNMNRFGRRGLLSLSKLQQ